MFGKHGNLLLISGALLLMSALPASATTVDIFTDNFNRGNSDTVGNGWTEYDHNAADVAIHNNQLRLRDSRSNTTIDAGVAQLGGLDATGLQDIMLSFDFKRNDNTSESSDKINVEWKLSTDAVWTLLFQHGLGNGASNYASVSKALGASADNASGILIRLSTNVTDNANGNTEGALVDNVVLSGTVTETTTTVPLPAGLPLLLSGLVGAGLIGRKRKARLV